MAEGSHKMCEGSSSSDALLSGESTRPVGRPVDRVYPAGLGLRPKACPRPHNATGTSTRDIPVQGPVDRCFTIVRAMNTDTADDDGANTVGPVGPTEASGCALNKSIPLTMIWVGRIPDLVSLPAGTEHRQGGMCCPLCPNAGCLASCAVLPATAPWESTSSDRPMTILRTSAFIMIYTNYMVSRSGQS